MKRKITPIDFAVYLFCLVIIMLTIMMATFKMAEVKFDNYKIVVLIILITFTYCFLVDKIKYSLFALPLILIIPRPLYIIGYLKTIIIQWNDFLDSFIINQYIADNYGDYFIKLMFILTFILTIVLYFIVVVRKRSLVVVVSGSILFAVYYFLNEINIFTQCSLFLVASLFLNAYNNYNLKRDSWLLNKSTIGDKYLILWIISAILLIAGSRFIIASFSYEIKPASFEWYEKNIAQRFEEIGNREYKTLSTGSYKMKFSLARTGFQQSPQRLGGAVKIDNSIALKVAGNGRLEDLHLRGTIKDNYNGYIWSKSETSTIKHKTKDSLEVGSYNIAYVYNDITIVPVKTETTTVFNALYPFKVQNKWEYFFVDSDTEIYHPSIARNEKSYKVTYKEYDVKSYNLSMQTDGKYSSNVKKYLQLSNSVPKRVIDLTDEIILKYRGNPYLTASAIEKYLKKNYPYSLSTSNLPQGRDFVDYFLFDEKKGSCTYYATAMAVMCRIAGIPTRYIEGYDIPATAPKNGYIEVSNANAHAWVEVYFENAGWVVFDPTPGHNSAAEEAQIDQSAPMTPDQANTPELNNKDNKNNNQEQMQDLQDEGNKSTGVKNINITQMLFILLPLMLILALAGINKLVNYILLKGKRFASYSLYKIMKYGKLMNVPYQKGYTIREYMEKLNRTTELNLNKYIVLYESMLYNSEEMSQLEQRAVHKALKNVKKKAAETRGKFRVYIVDFTGTFTYLCKMHKM